MPLSTGMCRKNTSSASNPPADAPIPTMGKPSGSKRGLVGPTLFSLATRLLVEVGWRFSVFALEGLFEVTLRRDGFRFTPMGRPTNDPIPCYDPPHEGGRSLTSLSFREQEGKGGMVRPSIWCWTTSSRSRYVFSIV